MNREAAGFDPEGVADEQPANREECERGNSDFLPELQLPSLTPRGIDRQCYPKNVSEEAKKMQDEPVATAPEPTAETAAAWEAEKAELQERNLRIQAEFQNFRRRAERERLEFSEYASMEAVRTLVPILDDFERALKTESGTENSEYVKGMGLIHQRLAGALEKLGLEPIESVGKIFDPNLHHAVEKVETSDVPDETILDEFQRGYNFKGRLLRAAMVKVAVEPK